MYYNIWYIIFDYTVSLILIYNNILVLNKKVYQIIFYCNTNFVFTLIRLYISVIYNNKVYYLY